MRPLIHSVEGRPQPPLWPPWPGGDTIYADGQWWTGPAAYAPSSAPAKALLSESPAEYLRLVETDLDVTQIRGNEALLRFPDSLARDEHRARVLFDLVEPPALEPSIPEYVRLAYPEDGIFFNARATHISGSLYELDAAIRPSAFPRYDLLIWAIAPTVHVLSVLVGTAGPTATGVWPLRQRQSLIGGGSWPLRQRQNGAHSGSWALRQRQTGI